MRWPRVISKDTETKGPAILGRGGARPLLAEQSVGEQGI